MSSKTRQKLPCSWSAQCRCRPVYINNHIPKMYKFTKTFSCCSHLSLDRITGNVDWAEPKWLKICSAAGRAFLRPLEDLTGRGDIYWVLELITVLNNLQASCRLALLQASYFPAGEKRSRFVPGLIFNRGRGNAHAKALILSGFLQATKLSYLLYEGAAE